MKTRTTHTLRRTDGDECWWYNEQLRRFEKQSDCDYDTYSYSNNAEFKTKKMMLRFVWRDRGQYEGVTLISSSRGRLRDFHEFTCGVKP